MPVALLALTAIGAVIQALGVAPWLLIAGAFALAWLVLVRWMPADVALAATLSGALAGYTVLIRVTPFVGLDLGMVNGIVLVLVSAAAGGVLWRTRRSRPAAAWRPAAPLLIGLAPVGAIILALLVAVVVSGGTRLTWALQNDAVWNTMTARFIWLDHGVTAARPNASPLTSALLAGSFAPGRSATQPLDLLQHDVTRQAELWLLLILVTCVLAGAVAFRSLDRLAPVARTIAVFAVACLPLGWYVAGYAIQFGFFNATVTVLLLLCAWIAWHSASTAPTRAVVILALVSVAVLATWAPIAALPVSLIVAVLATAGRAWWTTLPRRLPVLIVSALAVAGYALGATLPDLLREGGALAAEGAMFALMPRQVLLVVGVTVTGVVAAAIVRRERRAALGVGVVVVAAGLVITFLMLQRRGLASLWGYYPAKFAWLVLILLLVILAVSLLGWATGRAPRVVLALLGSGLVVGALTSIPSPTADALRALPSIVAPEAVGVDSETPLLLFSLSDPRDKTIIAQYGLSTGAEQFVNGWLIQQGAMAAQDPIRAYAYVLDGTSAEQLCTVARLWGGGVTIRTLNADLVGAIGDTCPAEGITVVVD